MPIARSLSVENLAENGEHEMVLRHRSGKSLGDNSDEFRDNNSNRNNNIPHTIQGHHPSLSQIGTSFEDEQKDPVMRTTGGGGPDHNSNEEGMSWIQHKCGEIVDDERSQLFILLLIAINSIMIGMATFPAIKENESVMHTFEIVDLVVLIIFTVESTIQFIYNGPRRFFKDGWLVFDLVIVIISWISVKHADLKPFRVFRAFRFITQLALLRNVVVALFSIIPAITAIFTLLLLIFYIFGVMFTSLFKNLYSDGYTSADYFGRLDLSLFTLFQILCLDEWSGIAYEVQEYAYWAWAVFISFVVMSAFVVINLLIAVICDALQILRTAEEALIEEKLYGQEPKEDEQNEGGGGGNAATEGESGERLRQRIDEMQKMLDEMVVAQETMARTIQYLSIALYAERQTDDLLTREMSIRESIREDDSVKESLKEALSMGSER